MTRKRILIQAERTRPFTLELGPQTVGPDGITTQTVYLIEEDK